MLDICIAPSVISPSCLNQSLALSSSLLLSVSADIISVASPEVPEVTVRSPDIVLSPEVKAVAVVALPVVS